MLWRNNMHMYFSDKDRKMEDSEIIKILITEHAKLASKVDKLTVANEKLHQKYKKLKGTINENFNRT